MFDLPLPAKIIIASAVSILFYLLFDYFALPVYNFTSFGFWILIGVFSFILALIFGFVIDSIDGAKEASKIGTVIGIIIIALAIILSAGSWLIWPGNDKLYSKLLVSAEKDQASFIKDFPSSEKISGEKLLLPIIDKELSIK